MQLNIENLDRACQALSTHGDDMAESFEGFFSSLLKIRSRMTRVRGDVSAAVGAEASDCVWLKEMTDGLNKVTSLPMTRLTSSIQMRDSLEQRLSHVREGFQLLCSAPEIAQLRMARVLSAQAKSIADTLNEISESSMRSCESLAEGLESASEQIPEIDRTQPSNFDASDQVIALEASNTLQSLSGEIGVLSARISELGDHAQHLGVVAASMRKMCDAPSAATAPASLLAGLQKLYTSDVEHEVHQAELQRSSFPS
ncbi:MAG: hypothetical protein AAF557_26190 [Pseudomonadota bacterium]